MNFISKIGKAKAKISAWSEEREQKKFNTMRTQHDLAKKYNKREKENQKMQKEINKAKASKFNNSFLGKTIKGIKEFDEKVNSPSHKARTGRKGKKKKLKTSKSDMFGDGDPWGSNNSGGDGDPWG